MAAAAGIHRGHELEAGGIADAVVGPAIDDFAGFQRLAQTVEHLGLELRQLVEKQHAMMGERHLAGRALLPPPTRAAIEAGMMRRPERPAVGQRAAGERAGDRMDHRHFEKLARPERRQDRGQALRQHGLPRTRRPDHQEIVAAGRSDLQRALGALLALDVAQVGQVARGPARCAAPAATGPACP